MTKKTNNGFASQPAPASTPSQPKPMLNQLLTQPVVQLSTNLQQIRSLNSQSTSLPPQMSPFNPAARQRDPSLDASAQPMFSPMQTRPRPVATNNDVLHQFVVGNPQPQPPQPQPQPATPSSSGDRRASRRKSIDDLSTRLSLFSVAADSSREHEHGRLRRESTERSTGDATATVTFPVEFHFFSSAGKFFVSVRFLRSPRVLCLRLQF